MTNKFLFGLLTAGLFCCSALVASGDDDYRIFSLEAEHALEGRPYRLRGKISLPQGETIAEGETLQLRLRYDFGAMSIYNPFLSNEIPASAAVAVFDHNRRFVGDLLHRKSGKSRSPDIKDWMVNAQGGFIEIDRKLPATCLGRDGNEIQLVAGNYYLQVVFHTRLGSFPPLEGDSGLTLSKEALDRWRQRYADFGTCRSNIIELKVSRK